MILLRYEFYYRYNELWFVELLFNEDVIISYEFDTYDLTQTNDDDWIAIKHLAYGRDESLEYLKENTDVESFNIIESVFMRELELCV